MDIQELVTRALWTKDAIHELKDTLPKDGSRGEMQTLDDANSALAKLLERYRTGEWKAPTNGKNGNSKIEEITAQGSS